MRLRRLGIIGLTAFSLIALWSCAPAKTPHLTIQIQGVNFTYPWSEIERVTLMDGFPILSIHPPDPKKEVGSSGILFSINHFKEIKLQLVAAGILEKYPVDSAGAFLKLLYRDPGDEQLLLLLREVYEIDELIEFTEHRRKPFTIYRLKHPSPAEQRMYIVVDSDPDRIYTVNGHITDDVFKLLSANLSLFNKGTSDE